MSVNSKMTAIANQVRTLVGVSGTMGLDAMATNLANANGAMSGIRTQLANKGVTMPASADVLDIATYIGQIKAEKRIVGVMGVNNSKTITIYHMFGYVPQGFLLCLSPFSNNSYLYEDVYDLFLYDPNISDTNGMISVVDISGDSYGDASLRHGFIGKGFLTMNNESITLDLTDASGELCRGYQHFYMIWG